MVMKMIEKKSNQAWTISTEGFRNGWRPVSLRKSGARVWNSTMSWKGSAGSGKAWTAVWSSRLLHWSPLEGIQRTEEKMGTKRSVLVDEKGLPPAIVISGANTHDIKLLEETLDHIVVLRPEPDEEHPKNLCLDAGYTGSGEAVEQRNYIPHIRPRGEEKRELERNPDFRAHRWVVRLLTLFSTVSVNSWFDTKRKLPTIWLCFNSPALLLSGASLFAFIVNFGISS